MFFGIVDWFKNLSPTSLVLVIIAAILILAIIAVMISSVCTASKIKALKADSEKAEQSGQAASSTDKDAAEQVQQQQQTYAAATAPNVQSADTDSKQGISADKDSNGTQIIQQKQQEHTPADTESAQTEPVKKAAAPTKKTDSKVATVKKAQVEAQTAAEDSADNAELDAGKNIAQAVEEIQSKDRKNGKIVIYKDDADRFRFQIVAANHEPVGHSRSYGTKSACKTGLKAMLRYSDTEVYDLTLASNTFKPKIGVSSFEIYSPEEGKFRFRLRSKNYKLVLASQDYKTKAAANIGIDAVKRISENYTLETK